MKKALLFFTILFLFNTLNAQDSNTSTYLFKDFTNAIVMYKDGTQFSVSLNYDLKDGQFVFIDKSDNLKKKFANPELIGLIRVGDRCFILGNSTAKEVIQAEPKFYVAYIGKLISAAKDTSFGGSSHIASVDTYSSIAGDGLSTAIKDNNFELIGVNKTYEAEIKGKMKKFNDERTFLKALPKDKRLVIEKFIEDNKIDFENVNQVFTLYKYVNAKL